MLAGRWRRRVGLESKRQLNLAAAVRRSDRHIMKLVDNDILIPPPRRAPSKVARPMCKSHRETAAELRSWRNMDIKCSYCGCNPPFVKKSKLFAKAKFLTGYEPVMPLCGTCLQVFIKHPKNTNIEYQVKARLLEIENKAVLLNTGDPLNKIISFINLVEELEVHKKTIEQRFNTAANEAHLYAKQLVDLEKRLTPAKIILGSRFKSNYETCRRVANTVNGSPMTRKAVFERDGFKCKYCGASSPLTIDHITPVKLGGNNHMDNLQCLCLTCNISKGSRAPVKEAA